MTETGKLVERLAELAEPVRPLPRPSTRGAIWLAISAVYVAAVVFAISPRADLAAKLAEWRFVVEQAAVLLTGVAAAVAAFAMTVPGYDRRVLLLPLPPLALWLGSLGVGCIQDFARLGLSGLSLEPDWVCFPGIMLVGAVPAIAMVAMLRRGALVAPLPSAAYGGLAAAGIGEFGLRLFHPQDASLMVLVWQAGTVLILTLLAAWFGRRLLNWRPILEAARRRIAG